MTEWMTATTVGALRAALADLPDTLPVVLDGGGQLDIVQRGEERADVVRRGGFVEEGVAADRAVAVLWLLGSTRDA